jgi:hypothetical protein
MTTGITLPADLSTDTYLVLGLATCFIKQEGGKLQSVKVIEPIPSAALEVIVHAIPTSYELAVGTTLGAILADNTLQRPAAFPADAQFGESFIERAIAAARSYKARPAAQDHIPLGQVRQDFKFSTERKRTLNAERMVTAEDNVKQHAYTHQVL